ncbi:hypothetical protein OROMI_017449 [Orobanche minor]
MAQILFFRIRPSQEILKIRDGTPLEAEGILAYRKSTRNLLVWHFSSRLYVPSNVVQKKRVARIQVFKIRPSQEILKIRDDVPSNVVQKKRVAQILVFKIRPSQEILKIRDGTPLEAEGILAYRKSTRNGLVWHFSNKLDVPSNVVQKKRVARILFFTIRPSQEILKIRDGTPLEAEGILAYRKSTRNGLVWHFSSKLDVPSNVVQKKRVARILVFKIRPSQEILKIHDDTPLEEILQIRDGTPLEKKKVAWILFFRIRPSQEILKIRDGTPLEAEGILAYRKSTRNLLVWHFSSKLYVPSNVVQKKRVARIEVFKIRPSQEILKISDGTPLESEGILTYRKKPSKWIGLEILQIRDGTPLEIIRPSQEILKIRDGTPLEAEGILAYRKSTRNLLVWHFSSKLYVPSNVVQKKRVARIEVFKIRPSQEILKIRDVQKKRVAQILVFKIRPSQEILKIRDGTPLEAEGILAYRKSTRNGLVWHFSNKLDVPSNVVQKKRVARILFFTIRPSQEILKIRDGTPLEAEGILAYRKSTRNGLVWHFSSKLDVPSNVVQKKRVARILVFQIRPSQEILKIHDDTPLEAEEF